MISDLISLLEKCTVRLLGTRGWQGTGFFVAPGIVLTCSHVVRLESIGSEDIIVEWKSQTFTGVLRLAVPNPYTDENPFPDVAIVDVRKPGSPEKLDQHPCVLLDAECSIGDDLYAFGFPRGKPGGDSITA